MVDERSKILILVEGAKTDYRLMERLLKVYGITENHNIVSYNTNIYTLYHQMFKDGDPASIDILQNLKQHEKDEQKKKLFDERYSDILLIFDLDPQAPDFSAEKIEEMMAYFVESSDMGKLYLNYPMVESFYHMKSIPDNDYNTYTASMNELLAQGYKSRVNKENRNHDYSKFAVSREECSIVISQNVEKAWNISANEPTEKLGSPLPPEAIDILNAQLMELEEKNRIFVLCTCPFYILDYNPHLLEAT